MILVCGVSAGERPYQCRSLNSRPGQYDVVGRWNLGVQPFERGVALGKIFAIALADAAAVLGDGFIRDEIGLIGGGDIAAGRSIARLLRCPSQDESAILSALSRD